MEKPDVEVNPIPPDENPQGMTYEEMPDEMRAKLDAAGDASHAKQTGKGEMTTADLFRGVTAAMNHQFQVAPWKKFPANFHVMSDETGEMMFFESNAQQVLVPVGMKRIKKVISNYIERSGHIPVFPRRNTVDEIFSHWAFNSTPLERDQIKNVRQLSKPGFTFRRLPWDLVDGDTPLFDELMARTSNAEALMDFIGSLFFDEADRQTYCWIFGAGGDGKGSLMRVLEKVFGQAYGAENTEFVNNFWMAGIVSKRLVVFSDCDDYRFVTTGLFKSLTGGDQVRIERKGEMPYHAQISPMFIFLSNDKPLLNLKESDLRRVIFAHMRKPTARFEKYESRLWDEAKSFLWKCVKGYRARYPEYDAINADRTEAVDLAMQAHEFNQMIFDRYFEARPVNPLRKASEQPHTTTNRVQRAMADEKMTPSQKIHFYSFLRDVMGFENKKVKLENGTTERRWIGFEPDFAKNVVAVSQGRG